jgi:hypothetical protein
MRFQSEERRTRSTKVKIIAGRAVQFVMFTLLRFDLDVQRVMTTRILRMMTGELSPREALRMITEKQTA